MRAPKIELDNVVILSAMRCDDQNYQAKERGAPNETQCLQFVIIIIQNRQHSLDFGY